RPDRARSPEVQHSGDGCSQLSRDTLRRCVGTTTRSPRMSPSLRKEEIKMKDETSEFRQEVAASANATDYFVWPLGTSLTPDEMNTSYGPRIDADRWDFHDGIDLPASVGTAVHAIADGVVHRAGPADKTDDDQGFGSTHVVLRVVDPA